MDNLSSERLERLNEIGFVWNVLELKWEERYCELLSYKTKHGNTAIPVEESTGLGRWLATQRTLKRSGGISVERARRLDEIGLELNLLDEEWNNKFKELIEYKNNNGDTNVPTSWHVIDLRNWVKTQRQLMKKGKLTPERRALLEEIGFEQNAFDCQWKEMYEKLVIYHSEYDHTNIPTNHPNGLGVWVI